MSTVARIVGSANSRKFTLFAKRFWQLTLNVRGRFGTAHKICETDSGQLTKSAKPVLGSSKSAAPIWGCSRSVRSRSRAAYAVGESD